MKKAFSLIEVLVASLLLSVVVLAFYKIQSNNIHIVNKAKNQKQDTNSLLLALNLFEYKNRNENIYISKEYKLDDDLNSEFKNSKVKIKDEILDTNSFSIDSYDFKVTKLKTNYKIENSLEKNIYGFKLEF